MNNPSTWKALPSMLLVALGLVSLSFAEPFHSYFRRLIGRTQQSSSARLEQWRLGEQAATLAGDRQDLKAALENRQALDMQIQTFTQARADAGRRLSEHRRALEIAWGLLGSQGDSVRATGGSGNESLSRATVASDVRELLRSCDTLEQEVSQYQRSLAELTNDLADWDARLEEIEARLQLRAATNATQAGTHAGRASRQAMIQRIEDLEQSSEGALRDVNRP